MQKHIVYTIYWLSCTLSSKGIIIHHGNHIKTLNRSLFPASLLDFLTRRHPLLETNSFAAFILRFREAKSCKLDGTMCWDARKKIFLAYAS